MIIIIKSVIEYETKWDLIADVFIILVASIFLYASKASSHENHSQEMHDCNACSNLVAEQRQAERDGIHSDAVSLINQRYVHNCQRFIHSQECPSYTLILSEVMK